MYCKTTSTHKYCPDCGEDLLLSEFYNSRSTGSGKTAYCKEHQTARTNVWRKNNRARVLELQKECVIRTQYGLSMKEYNDLLSTQRGLCAICERPERVANRRLAIDHCHTTGRVRGLLCRSCNVSLGNFNDSVELLQKAIEYINVSKA